MFFFFFLILWIWIVKISFWKKKKWERIRIARLIEQTMVEEHWTDDRCTYTKVFTNHLLTLNFLLMNLIRGRTLHFQFLVTTIFFFLSILFVIFLQTWSTRKSQRACSLVQRLNACLLFISVCYNVCGR